MGQGTIEWREVAVGKVWRAMVVVVVVNCGPRAPVASVHEASTPVEVVTAWRARATGRGAREVPVGSLVPLGCSYLGCCEVPQRSEVAMDCVDGRDGWRLCASEGVTSVVGSEGAPPVTFPVPPARDAVALTGGATLTAHDDGWLVWTDAEGSVRRVDVFADGALARHRGCHDRWPGARKGQVGPRDRVLLQDVLRVWP